MDTFRGLTVHTSAWFKVMRDGVQIVKVRCPECAVVQALDHDIAADGTVSPSLDCSIDGCDFHETVRLAGWRE